MNIRSVVQGRILEILVTPGQSVREGDELLIIESMKMEVPVQATVSGTVASVHAVVGDAVAEGDVVVVLS
ncbi:MAG: biotin/lipoyl-containing protein [Dehalococcoidia bacterium]